MNAHVLLNLLNKSEIITCNLLTFTAAMDYYKSMVLKPEGRTISA